MRLARPKLLGLMLVIGAACGPISIGAQTIADSTNGLTSGPLFESLARMDSVLFHASFASCDAAKANAIFTDDVEFYHDQGGFTAGEQVRENTRRLTASCPRDRGVTRTLIPGSLRVYPIQGYGAAQMGVHRFDERGASTGTLTRFVHLWRFENGKWRLARVLSLDHHPVPAIAMPTSCGTPDGDRNVAPHNYVFFRRDHQRIADTAFLANPNLIGAQLTYTWRELEPAPDQYEFGAIREHLAFLTARGKRLFLQLQDVSFSDRVLTPDYLRSDPAYHGGVAPKYEAGSDGRARFGGWVARRWDPAVRERFARLLSALSREFDGTVEGVVLAETSVGFDDPERRPPDFSVEGYAVGIREMLTAARAAFRRSCVVVYANFMPGESLPATDRGFLRGVHAHAATIGAGVGGPDVLPYRPFQWSNSLSLIEKRPAGVVAAMAVQDGNLADRNRSTGQRITVSELYGIAVTRLRLNYIFWGTEEPYFTSEVQPFLRNLRR